MALLPTFDSLPLYTQVGGLRTGYATVLPPGGLVTYLRSTGATNLDPPEIKDRLTTTLAQALLQCRANAGDVIYVLPGHAENVTTSPTFIAGVRIIGVGDIARDDAPTFTWTATTSQWAITVKNVEISGLRLLCDGANGVVKAIVTTAAGMQMKGNFIRWSSGASNLATIGIEIGSGATDTAILGNYITGVAAGSVTDGIKLVGATVPSRTRISGNAIIAAGVSATGLIDVTVAALNLIIQGNLIENVTASSIAAISFANVACDGMCCDNYITVKSTGALSAGVTGITVGGTNNLVGFHQNFVVNDVNKSGILAPAADT